MVVFEIRKIIVNESTWYVVKSAGMTDTHIFIPAIIPESCKPRDLPWLPISAPWLHSTSLILFYYCNIHLVCWLQKKQTFLSRSVRILLVGQVRKDFIKKFRYEIAYLWILDLNLIWYNNWYYVICLYVLSFKMTFMFFITGLFRN